MTTRQEILLRLACAALQGGMSVEEVFDNIEGVAEGGYSLWDIANILPDIGFDADIPPKKDTKSTTDKKKFY